MTISNMAMYCVSKKYWPVLCSKLLYKMGHYFLDTQYSVHGSPECVDPGNCLPRGSHAS